MKWSGFLVAAVFAALTFGLWAYVNRPTAEPPWPARVQGMAFSPFQAGQDPFVQALPDEQQIDSDLRLLAGKVTAVRSYSTLKSLGRIPELAARYDLKVTVGAWLDRRLATNDKEVAAAIELARQHPNVIRLVIGNEAILRGDLNVAQLTQQLDRVREAVAQPVSTAEPWHVWLKYPELVEHVDYLAVHLLPYWEGIPVDRAIEYVVSNMEQLHRAYPSKPIVIAEVGWPSDGRTRGGAVASTSNQAMFLRRFLDLARREGYVYYLMEAFDQPWKARYQGAVEAYWGVYDVYRQPKFAFVEPIVRIPQWQTLAAVSVAISTVILALLYIHSLALGTRGRSLLAVVVYGVATTLVWIIYDYSRRYLTVSSILIGTLLILGMLGVIAVLITEALEWAEARWGKPRKRPFDLSAIDMPVLPKVSIHVPAFNEPPEMLIDTLDALAALDYPDYEVIVVDNNTPDLATWRPVEEHCRTLGERFKFYHVAPLKGFKAGALNYALKHTATDARVVAVIDSDYKVEPHWLRTLVPAFADDNLAIVQSPQDYRDAEESAFKAMCYAEYRGFFHIGMVVRNERNAIIQHGTMTLVRHSALTRVGGWAEWCITEDAELGLRLFEHGYEAQYLPATYGRGLMPETFIDYKKQRFRWAYGAVQILRAHADVLLSSDARLTKGQRYHFIAGWLPWMMDGLNLVFNLFALVWSAAMIVAPHRFDPPLMMFSVLPLALFAFKLAKLAHLYASRVGANIRQTLAAALAGLALSHVVSVAVVQGLLTRSQPFFRTPKGKQPHALIEGFAAARAETAWMVVLVLAAVGLTGQYTIAPGLVVGIPEELKAPDVSLWVAVLLIQAIPHAASLVMSLISALSLPARWLGRPPMSTGVPAATPFRAQDSAD
ncbi:glycosyltransferase [Steroidobacter agaridevorans]|uniref:glycosyltransferase n=1 Tax=Steroidobacter agaridevorans TaxID=2695856 RepID=UPI0013232DEE|nr:glycosyltransferase [Steroidobacter agaridevorans]GFE88101.1 glycosyl transferase [Steroidobacter agaridevorans]